MDKTLAIHVEPDFLIAGIEPLKDKYHQITKRGIEKFPFYFFIDKINYKIDYGFSYKEEFLKAQQQQLETVNKVIVGDFLNQITDKTKTYKWYDFDNELINLVLVIFDDLRSAYLQILRTKFKDEAILDKDTIPVKISFSDNLSPEIQKTFKDFLSNQNFRIEKDNLTFADLIVNHHIEKNRLKLQNKKIAIIEALSDNLNMSVVSIYNEYDRERSHFQAFNDFGIDPRVRVIAKKVVDDVNRQIGLLTNDEQKDKEYKRHYSLAERLVNQLETQKRPYLDVETTFEVAPDEKLKTTLSVEEIEQLTTFHVRQISRYFEQHFIVEHKLQVEDLETIILFGNMLNNEVVKREFARFGDSRLVYLNDSDISNTLYALLSKGVGIEEEPTVNQSVSGEYRKVEFLTVASLQAGQQVRIHCFDPAQGKGASQKEFLYLGNNRFQVLMSTRSLLPNDVAIVVTAVWVAGIQIELEIERSGKILGKYRTRPMVSIEIK